MSNREPEPDGGEDVSRETQTFLGFDPADVEVVAEWVKQPETYRRHRFRLVEVEDDGRAVAKRTEEKQDGEWSVGPYPDDDWSVFVRPDDFREVTDVDW